MKELQKCKNYKNVRITKKNRITKMQELQKYKNYKNSRITKIFKINPSSC